MRAGRHVTSIRIDQRTMTALLLQAANLKKAYGPEPVLAGVSVDVRAGQKISLVGPNGAGKTTLLRIIAAVDPPDGGTVERAAGLRVGYLEQQPEFHGRRSVWEEARDALGHLTALLTEAEQLAKRMSQEEDDQEREKLGMRYDTIHQQLLQADGYHLDHRIERVLEGLGFARSQFHQPASQLSGGQQTRLLMARLLLSDPDLLLLDEPSNHLDLDATQWLEDYLAASPGALIVVSHDRFFLDKVADHTWELFRGTVVGYRGNFSAYCRQKAEQLEIERRTYERQQAEIARMEDFVRRHHYGQKHAQAEDRRKKLSRIERVPPPREITAPPMTFPPPTRCGDVALRVEHLAKSYEHLLFDDLTFDVQRGEKWGILGPNGCGKTTLLKCILGQETPDRGRVIWGTGVELAYFDQHLRELSENDDVLEAVRPTGRLLTEQQRRDLLARFGIAGDMVHQRIGQLSGGERNRVALARVAAMEANVLVLDEPTNHLDLWSRDALERALAAFEGTLLIVSHDRYFLNRVVDHMLVAQGRRYRVIDGNYDTYCHLLKVRSSEKPDDDGGRSQDTSRSPNKAARERNKARRKRKFPYRKISDLEADIAACESRVEELHGALATPDVVRDGQRVKSIQAELAECQEKLAALYEHWEEAIELN